MVSGLLADASPVLATRVLFLCQGAQGVSGLTYASPGSKSLPASSDTSSGSEHHLETSPLPLGLGNASLVPVDYGLLSVDFHALPLHAGDPPDLLPPLPPFSCCCTWPTPVLGPQSVVRPTPVLGASQSPPPGLFCLLLKIQINCDTFQPLGGPNNSGFFSIMLVHTLLAAPLPRAVSNRQRSTCSHLVK